MTVYKNYELLSNAKQLRKNMTPEERKLWYLFLRKYPVKVYKQRIIENFIADFYCASANLVIEIDGSQHYTDEQIKKDQQRSMVFQQYGLQILRFSNKETNYHFDAVCQHIHQTIQKATNA